ncbi:MAG TPA: haloacid dehalogenase-like hydrolase [Vicinamibacterales bacterium]|nr:haloacid dehalogenase-like hydrolase [Vicinamibacterales bacterium]
MARLDSALVVWDVDGTLIPADLRWLRRAVSRTYGLEEEAVVFPTRRVHGYTDESIAVDTAISSGIDATVAEDGIARFAQVLAQVMDDGRGELAREQPAYPGAADAIAALHAAGAVQTVLTGNLRQAAEVKLATAGLDALLDLEIGGYGSDARDRFELPAVVSRRFAAKFGRPLVPGHAVVIGDAPNDIACARHAGFRVVAVTHRLSREELAPHGPDAIVESLDARHLVDVVASLAA